MFKLYDCDVGIKVDGVAYDFEHVVSVTVEDPRRNRLTRGNNAKNNVGLVYMDGLKDPIRITVPILDMSPELKALFDTCFKEQKRLDFYAISRKDGSSKMGKNSILSNNPQQLTLDDTAESLQVSLEFETFDSTENLKT